MDALNRVRSLCLAHSGATERLSHGSPCFFAANQRQFAAFADNHHGDGRIALWLAAPLGAQELLIESDPVAFFRPPYVGPRGWIGVCLDRVHDELLAGLVEEAHAAVMRRR